MTTRDDLLAMVSHDMRSMLGGIALGAEQLLLSPDDPAKTRLAAERMRRFLARLNRLVGDLLDIASIEAGKVTLDIEPEDAGELVREVVQVFRPNATAKAIALECAIPEAPVRAELDRDRMLQVLANLLSNAIKFTPRGGRVEVRVEGDGDELAFRVSDTGPGVPATLRRAIFDRFWQVEDTDHLGQLTQPAGALAKRLGESCCALGEGELAGHRRFIASNAVARRSPRR